MVGRCRLVVGGWWLVVSGFPRTRNLPSTTNYQPPTTNHQLTMVVQKFGGTSVADAAAIGRLVDIVRHAREQHRRGPAVVVSAMSGVTDVLLTAASAAAATRFDDAV